RPSQAVTSADGTPVSPKEPLITVQAPIIEAKIIETDEGTHYFGEMALVDVDSPLSSMNTVFYTTLYDENASCHIAIGAGLADIKDPEEREKAGVNNSFIHVDFMVGSRELNIQGQREDGSWEDVFVNGSWGPLFRL
ncbi:MAG: aminopeptidase, partial [Erysipelotrichaceae bacterium]|nr:aminopeptidase [Erysipelotrichaceae bacterium]